MNTIAQQILEYVEKLPDTMQEETLDFVRCLQGKQMQAAKEPNGKKVAAVMTEIAARGTAFRHVKDPVAWQRDIRKDRPLPGRDA